MQKRTASSTLCCLTRTLWPDRSRAQSSLPTYSSKSCDLKNDDLHAHLWKVQSATSQRFDSSAKLLARALFNLNATISTDKAGFTKVALHLETAKMIKLANGQFRRLAQLMLRFSLTLPKPWQWRNKRCVLGQTSSAQSWTQSFQTTNCWVPSVSFGWMIQWEARPEGLHTSHCQSMAWGA